MAAVNLADWEDSKENIKPLRGGRDPQKLSEAFRDPAATANKLMAERQYVKNLIHYLFGCWCLHGVNNFIGHSRTPYAMILHQTLWILGSGTQIFLSYLYSCLSI
jgi:hypothetical protein